MSETVKTPGRLEIRFEADDEEVERILSVPADRPYEIFSILEHYQPRCRVSVWDGDLRLCSLRLGRSGLYEIVRHAIRSAVERSCRPAC